MKKNLVFVKVETDSGVIGWGEAYTQTNRDTSVTAHVEQLAHYLLGRSPFTIKHFMQWAYDDFAAKRGGMDFWCAFSGIEQALWDIVGKTLNQPIYNLLGGPCRDRIRVYANGWSDDTKTPQELEKDCITSNQWVYNDENIMNGGEIGDGLFGFDTLNNSWAQCDNGAFSTVKCSQ